jgi:hypothetical protein
MNDSSSNTIEQIICDRIRSTKDKLEKTNLRTETDRLWVRVETLQWVLAQIRMLKQHIDGNKFGHVTEVADEIKIKVNGMELGCTHNRTASMIFLASLN